MKVDTTASERHTLLKGENKLGSTKVKKDKTTRKFH